MQAGCLEGCQSLNMQYNKQCGPLKQTVEAANIAPLSRSLFVQGSVETIARGHEASVRIAMQGHHAAAAAARLPVATLSQMLKSALSVELDTRQVSQRLMRLIKADRWHLKAEQILRSHAKPTGAALLLIYGCRVVMVLELTCTTQYCAAGSTSECGQHVHSVSQAVRLGYSLTLQKFVRRLQYVSGHGHGFVIVMWNLFVCMNTVWVIKLQSTIFKTIINVIKRVTMTTIAQLTSPVGMCDSMLIASVRQCPTRKPDMPTTPLQSGLA